MRIFILFFLFSLSGCLETVKNIKGKWTITEYHFGYTYAINNDQVKQFIGKELTIGSTNYKFPFEKLERLKKIFTNNKIRFTKVTRRKIKTHSFFFKTSPKWVPPNMGSCFIYEFNGENTPFSSLLEIDNNHLVSIWDGVYFLLTRSKY